MAKTTGYPLPPGDCYTEDMCPIVVCVPNKDEYFQALWGTLSYLATWTAWETDTDKRGKDAAASWRFANEAMEIGDRMGCLDDLKADINGILLLLQSRKDCCDSNITYNTQTVITTTIIPGDGDPPDEWGGEEITTWDEWEEYVCYHAHAYVDKLVENATTLHLASGFGAIGIGTVGAILAGLTFIGLAIPVTWLIAAGIAAAAFYFAEDVFEDTADELEAARDDIVCAIMQGGDLADVIEAALSSGAEWDNIYQYVDYETAMAVIHEGGYNSEYLEAETRDDCECDLPAGYNWVEADDIQFTLHPDTFGRLNSGLVTLPNMKVGYKVATSASWGCMGYPAGAATVNVKNTTYQTLAVRYTYIANTGNSHPYYDYACRNHSPGHRHIWFYTYDAAEGIDATWAATQSDTHRLEAGGHAKRAINYSWPCGETLVGDTVPGATPVYFTVKLEHLVWVP